jgi:hypothetical protein
VHTISRTSCKLSLPSTTTARVVSSRIRSVRVTAVAYGNSSGNASGKASVGDASPPDLCAWKGDLPPQSSLPLKADGTPDYTSIDKTPISKVLTATIRKLLVKEVRISPRCLNCCQIQ